MTVLTIPAPAVRTPEPSVRRWTKAEFYQMADLGLFMGQRAELIEGEIMVQSPQKAGHFTTTERVREALSNAFGTGFHGRMQGPLDLGQTSEPDVAVETGDREDHRRAHPQTAVLVAEISDTTLAYDQREKASLYARAGIADYWIVNLAAEQVEVYRDPLADASPPHGSRYATVHVFFRGMSVAPLAKPASAIAVAALLG